MISTQGTSAAHVQKEDECPICLEVLSRQSSLTLPCGHSFHGECIQGLRQVSIVHACSLCRAEFPPGPGRLYDDASRRCGVWKRQQISDAPTTAEDEVIIGCFVGVSAAVAADPKSRKLLARARAKRYFKGTVKGSLIYKKWYRKYLGILEIESIVEILKQADAEGHTGAQSGLGALCLA